MFHFTNISLTGFILLLLLLFLKPIKVTVRSKISETCIGASTILRRVTSLKDEKGDLITDSHGVWLGRGTFVFDIEMAIEKLKRHKSPGTDKIPVELIKAGGRRIRSEIHVE